MTEHTPGPWHRNIKPASRYPTIYAGRNTHVCSVSRQDDETMEANLLLIRAAPDMLAALKDAELFLANEPNRDKDGWMSDTLAAIRAAIAKAKGE